MLKNNPEEDLIRFVVQKLINPQAFLDKDLSGLSSVQINRFKSLLIYHELVSFAYLALKDFNPLLPQDLMKFLKNNYYYALTHCAKIYQRLMKLLKAFKESGVAVVPIKGASFLLDVYEDKFIRPMVDIDLLVKEGAFERASSILYRLGYEKALQGLKEEYWRERQMHIVFFLKKEKRPPYIELHWSLDYKRKGHNLFPELWNRLRRFKGGSEDILLLSPEDNFLSLILHNRRFGKTLALKSVYDGMLILSKYKSFNWDYVLEICHKYELYTSLFFFVSQIGFLNEDTIPQKIKERLNRAVFSLKRKAIVNFIEKNTFSAENKDCPEKTKLLFLESHFLLYDSILEPLNYIINIPLEQFAKYYGMKPYIKRTKLFYRLRFFYIVFRVFRDSFKKQ